MSKSIKYGSKIVEANVMEWESLEKEAETELLKFELGKKYE